MKFFLAGFLTFVLLFSCHPKENYGYWVRIENASDSDFERVVSEYEASLESIYKTDFGSVSKYSKSDYMQTNFSQILPCNALKVTIKGTAIIRDKDFDCRTAQFAPAKFGKYTLRINYIKDNKIEASMVKD